MIKMKEYNVNKAVEIAEGVYWIGKYSDANGLHANPYVIVEGDEAIVIDGGSRPEFSEIMLKVLEIGVKPQNIVGLIYHHYDPDLCGSIPHFEEMINNDSLRIISQRHNNVFIEHYGTSSQKLCINNIGNEWVFKTGRKLRFINTPYSHSPGSFVTYDEKTKTLFSSDIFGSYSKHWELYLSIGNECEECKTTLCPFNKECFMSDIERFHRLIMTSKKALDYAVNEIKKYDIEMVAPQHGSIIKDKKNVELLIDKVILQEEIGIDADINKIIWGSNE